MKTYIVEGGTAVFGTTDTIALSADQFAPRRHLVEIVEKHDDGGATVRPIRTIEIKSGERVGLADIPKHMIDRLVPVSTPETRTEKLAAARVAARNDTAARISEKSAPAKKPEKASAAGVRNVGA